MKAIVENLKSQDILILSKFLVTSAENMRLQDIASDLGISISETSIGIRRLQGSRLLQINSRIPLRENALEFLVHGFKYVFPVSLGPVAVGVGTAHSFGKMKSIVVAASDDEYVWPDESGNLRGHSINPLYPSVSRAVKKDERLHQCLSLLDSIRIGRVREQVEAKKELEKLIFSKHG